MTTALVVFMEPAPYRIGLVRELRRAWDGSLDVMFIGSNLTQRWATDPTDVGAEFLPSGTLRALREIGRRLLRPDCRVLHVAGWGHPITLGSILCARLRGIPVVSETDTPAPFVESFWRRSLKALLYPRLFSLPRLFLPAGKRQAAYLKRYNVADERIRQGKLTVDVAGIAEFSSAFTAQKRAVFLADHNIATFAGTTFLFLGRLEPEKGLKTLLNAYVRLRTERSDVRLFVAGGGSLEALARAAAASIRGVYYLGHLTGKTVWEAYCSSDVFVLPTRRDSWGLVVNEAMAAGLPTIVSDGAGCIDDLVRHGETGLVYPRASCDALVAAMRELAESQRLRRHMGEGARRLIADWTLGDEARIIVSAWNDLMANEATGS